MSVVCFAINIVKLVLNYVTFCTQEMIHCSNVTCSS